MKRRKPRNYNGNPLAYYREHFEEFGEYKNRSQLSRGDSGLYRSLARAGQLEEAIPEANKISVELGRRLGKGELDLSEKDKRKIIRAYEPFDGNALKASKHLHYATSTVWTYWKRAGLDARGNKKLSESENKKLFKAYEKFGGNALATSRSLHHAVGTVLRYWRKFEFEIRKKGREAVLSETQINEAYKPSKGNASEAARNLNCCVDSVLRHWKKEGLEIRKRGSPKKD